MKYEKGSEWRKWDLHVHTPCTELNDGYSSDGGIDKWCLFFQKIENSDIAVFGITDYFSIKNYIKFIKEFKSKYPKSNKVFFPNIEFRGDIRNKEGEYIQFHVIFSNVKETMNKIEGFLERLPLVSTDDSDSTQKYCTKNDLSEITYDKAMVKLDKLKEGLSHDFAEDEYMLVGVANGYGTLRPEKGGEGRGGESAKELDKDMKMFFGIEKNTNFYLNKEGARSDCNLPPKPVLAGSDSHSFDDLNKKLGSIYTWIKADPTFEGLKQILYEPEGRVKIQANKPEEKSGYHIIESVGIDCNDCKQVIKLNPNLNAIIGGRSTGKSTLLQTIAYKINPKLEKSKEKNKHVEKIVNKTNIVWQDRGEGGDRDIEYFYQNYMHRIASDEGEKNELIEKIVKEKYKEDKLNSYERFCMANRETVQTGIDNLFKLQDELNKHIDILKKMGDKGGIEKEAESIRGKIQDISKDNNFSEEDLSKFDTIKLNIVKNEQLSQQLKEDSVKVVNLESQNLFNPSFVYNFNDLSEENRKKISGIFEEIKKTTVTSWEKKLEKLLEELKAEISKCDTDIKNDKDSAVFKKGQAYLEKNQQYKELSEREKNETEKLEKIANIQVQIDALDEQKKELFCETINNHVAYFRESEKLEDEFNLEPDDIEIKIVKKYRKEKCEGLLKDFINLQSHEIKQYVDDWVNNYENDIKAKVEDFLKKALNNEFKLKLHKNIQDLTKGLLIENWFSISYQLTYHNDTFEVMSDGKKAFVILKLLLEFSDKECPILIDQPEDSLDNRAIYNELVSYIKQKKKQRQIILVTHNANVVVNADAEEIIIANQHGKNAKNRDDIKFQYISGSLENTMLKDKEKFIVLESQGIREHACEILEGGSEAFKKREDKYGLDKK